MESDITNEHKEYLSSHHDIKLNSKMEKSTLIYWMSKCTVSVSKSTHSVLTKMYTSGFSLLGGMGGVPPN